MQKLITLTKRGSGEVINTLFKNQSPAEIQFLFVRYNGLYLSKPIDSESPYHLREQFIFSTKRLH